MSLASSTSSTSPFYSDLHIHSKYSRACSKDCDVEHLAWWARRKGLTVVGTGDFTHPAWFDYLCETLVPAEPGLFTLRPDLAAHVESRLPPACHGPVRFMLSAEIATIYKHGERTRKVHHLVYVPDFDAARRMTARLAKVGNLASDGRPILGIDSRDLLEITLHSHPDAYLVPAHIWTPWFSALGSKSGFDTVADCYRDLAGHIFAVETGLSSDPPMNYRLASLDGYRLVSNSDAHSPPMLAREATVFGTDMDYYAMRDALRGDDGNVETIEFFPEEGKYHLDGHRKCELRLRPDETRTRPARRGYACPRCEKPLTVGVLHRVEELADRPADFRPADADPFHSLVPLPEIVSEIRGVGAKSKTVSREVDNLVARLGPELTILRDAPVDDISRAGSSILAEGIARLRRGDVVRQAGYDGEYGAIRLFQPGENSSRPGASTLFDIEPRASDVPEASERLEPAAPTGAQVRPRTEPGEPYTPQPPHEPTPPLGEPAGDSLLAGLDPDQRAAAGAAEGPLLVVAGPGTGKTRTLTHRIAYLIAERGMAPEGFLAITFTRRARGEMHERLRTLVGAAADRITVTTFHGLGLAILRERHRLAGLDEDFRVADEATRIGVAEDVTGSSRDARRLLKARGPGVATDAEVPVWGSRYIKTLRAAGLVDFDDLITEPVDLLTAHPQVAAEYRQRHPHVCVDEYQDVDERQYGLLRLLTATQSDICAIGDPDQAIYGFRGADVGFFLRFGQDYPHARTVTLTRNYRSTPSIVHGATAAVRPATLTPGRTLRPSPDVSGAERVRLHAAGDEAAEADFVTRTIDELLGGSSFHSFDSGRVGYDGPSGHDAGELSFADIAVLYRTDRTARPIAEALTRAGMPFQKRSHDRLSARPGTSDLVRTLRYGDTVDPAALRAAARSAVAELPPSAAEREADINTAAELLAPLARHHEGDLERFLGELALGAEVDTWDPRADRISLLTAHAAKGLEFPVVFLVGCEDGLMPLRRPGDHETDLAEERRLLFVAMTRARSHLFLSYARSRPSVWGSGPAVPPGPRGRAQGRGRPSPFLDVVDDATFTRTGQEEGTRRKDRQLRLL